MVASAPQVERPVARTIRPGDTRHDTRIDADPGENLLGVFPGDRPRRGDNEVLPPEMQGMYYLG